MHERRSEDISEHAFTRHLRCTKGSEKDAIMMLDQFINTIRAHLLPIKWKNKLRAWLKDHPEVLT